MITITAPSWIWSPDGSDYEEYCLLGSDAVPSTSRTFQSTTFRVENVANHATRMKQEVNQRSALLVSLLGLLIAPEDEGSNSLRNAVKFVPAYMISHPRKYYCSQSTLWEPIIIIRAPKSCSPWDAYCVESLIFKEALRGHVCSRLPLATDLHKFALILRIRLYLPTTETWQCQCPLPSFGLLSRRRS